MDDPRLLPTTTTDRVIFLLSQLGLMMLQIEMQFAHRLDRPRLQRALALSLDAEPVMGCRLVMAEPAPYWERLDEPAAGAFRVANDASEFDAFRLAAHEPERGPQVIVCLWPAPPGDRLLLKVSHEIADAGGTKAVAHLLAHTYTQLGKNPDYVPAINTHGSRDYRQLWRHVPWHARLVAYGHYLQENWRNMVPTETKRVVVPVEAATQPEFVLRHLDRETVTRLAAWGRERRATLNDLLLAAFFRAVAEHGEGGPRAAWRVASTVDLRRYLPGGCTEGMCNLSGFEYYRLPWEARGDFAQTLNELVIRTRKRKASWLGLNGYVGLMPVARRLTYARFKRVFERMAGWGLSRGNLASVLTNLGPISAAAATFDEPASEAYMILTPIYAPGLGVGLSGYADTLTLSTGVFGANAARPLVERFLDTVLAELPR